MGEEASTQSEKVGLSQVSVDKEISRAIYSVGKVFEKMGYNATMGEINRRKALHAFLAKQFEKKPTVIVGLFESKWGRLVDYSYSGSFDASDARVSSSLLSLLIAERLLLAKFRNLLKHATIAIVGLKGSGKTTYAISSAIGALYIYYGVLESEGVGGSVSTDSIVDTVGRLVFFEPESFVSYVHDNLLSLQSWVPFIILDDIGAQISKYWIHIGEKWWSYLFSVLDHLKDWCGVLIMTATSFNSIPARLRDIADIVVETNEVDVGGSVMDLFLFYRRDKYVSSARREPVYIDVAPPNMLMPDLLWRKMRSVRRDIGIKRLAMVREELKRAYERRGRRGKRSPDEDLEEELEGSQVV